MMTQALVEALIDAGADMELHSDTGETAADIAVRQKQPGVVIMMERSAAKGPGTGRTGALKSDDTASEYGRQLAKHAAERGCPESVVTLLHFVDQVNSSYETHAYISGSLTWALKNDDVACPQHFALCRAGTGFVVSSSASAGMDAVGAGLYGTYRPVYCPTDRAQDASTGHIECFGKPVYHRTTSGPPYAFDVRYSSAFIWYGTATLGGETHQGVWLITEPLDPRSINPCDDTRSDDQSFCTSDGRGVVETALLVVGCPDGPDECGAGQWIVSERNDIPKITTLPNGERVAMMGGGGVVVAPEFAVSPLVCSDGSSPGLDTSRCVAAPGYWEDYDGVAHPCPPVAHQHKTDPGLTCTHQWSQRVKKCAKGYTLCPANPTFSVSVSGGSKHWSGIYKPLVNATCYGKQVYQSAQCGEGSRLGVDRFPPAVLYWEGTGHPTNWMIQSIQSASLWLHDLPRTGKCGDSGSAFSNNDNMFGRWKEPSDQGTMERSSMRVTAKMCSDGTTPDPTADTCAKARSKGKKAKRNKSKPFEADAGSTLKTTDETATTVNNAVEFSGVRRVLKSDDDPYEYESELAKLAAEMMFAGLYDPAFNFDSADHLLDDFETFDSDIEYRLTDSWCADLEALLLDDNQGNRLRRRL
jgi:hypothetical protein